MFGLFKKKNLDVNEVLDGFKIDDPSLFVPWSTNPVNLKDIFSGYELRCVVEDRYYTISCEVLDGLKCKLGFHFKPGGKLEFLEIFDIKMADIYEEFEYCQGFLERKYGKEFSGHSEDKDYPSYTWRVGKIKILHCISERFGLEHHVNIINTRA